MKSAKTETKIKQRPTDLPQLLSGLLRGRFFDYYKSIYEPIFLPTQSQEQLESKGKYRSSGLWSTAKDRHSQEKNHKIKAMQRETPSSTEQRKEFKKRSKLILRF